MTETAWPTTEIPRNNQPTCTLTDHQAVDEESKVDLENHLIENIQNTYKIFESMANLNAGRSPYGTYPGLGGFGGYGYEYPSNSANEPQDKYTYTPKNYGEPKLLEKGKKAKVVLPNPQNYINRLESCRGVKSERVAKALEKEIAKFKIQDASAIKRIESKPLDQ